MKVIIAGSREITDYSLLLKAIKKSNFEITEVVSGNARGVDRLGEKWAKENNIPIKQFIPDWDGLGKKAGFIRNAEMAKYADAAIIVHNESNGSKNMIACMIDLNKPYCDLNTNLHKPLKSSAKKIDLDPNVLDYNCSYTWKIIGEGNVEGLFQIESYLGKKLAKQLKPENIDHLAGLISIMRPSCLEGKLEDGKSITDHYILRKNGKEEATPFHPALEPILKDTYQLMIYQEQAIKIAQELAGMSLEDADTYIRKGIGKKKPEVIAQAKKLFLAGCKVIGKVNEEEAQQIFGWIEKGQRYSFNKSHAVSYAYLCYNSAYIKTHTNLDFYKSWLNHCKTKQKPLDAVANLVYNAKKYGITIEPPCLLHQNRSFEIKNNRLIYGLSHIKEVGDKDCDKLFEQFKNVNFKHCTYLCIMFTLLNVKKTAVKRLISVGALDYLNIPRTKILYDHEQLLHLTAKEKEWIKQNIDLNNYQSLEEIIKLILDAGTGKGCAISNKNRASIIDGIYKSLKNPPFPLVDDTKELASWEKSYLGLALSCSKLDLLQKSGRVINCYEFDMMPNDPYSDVTLMGEILFFNEIIDKNGNEMAFLSIADSYNKIEAVAFKDAWAKVKDTIQNYSELIFVGSKNQESFSIKQVTIPQEKQ